MPKGLTAATGMDALTHAIEGCTTKAAWEMTDMFHLKAIELIARHLRGAVENTAEGREGMALAQYVAGMGFPTWAWASYTAWAHGLGALYDTPHGVANAIILPVVMEYNAPYTGEKYREIARAMGVEGVDAMTQEEYRKAARDAVRKLGQDWASRGPESHCEGTRDVQFPCRERLCGMRAVRATRATPVWWKLRAVPQYGKQSRRCRGCRLGAYARLFCRNCKRNVVSVLTLGVPGLY